MSFNLRKYQKEQAEKKRKEFQAQHSIDGVSQLELSIFDDLLEENKNLQKIDEQGLEQLKTFRQLEQDIYSAFYQSNPEVNEGQMFKSFKTNREIVKQIMALEDYSKLRRHTKNDREMSSMVSVTMAEKAIELLTELQKKKINEQYAKDQMKMMGGGNGNGDSQDGDGEGESGEQKDNSSGQGNSAGDQENDQNGDDGNDLELNEQEMNDLLNQMAAAASQQMKEEIKDAEEKEAAVKSFGNQDGSLTGTSYEAAQEIFNQVKKSPLLREVCQIVGRMKEVAKKIRMDRMIDSREEIVDTEMGNDLSRVLSSELALFDHSGEEEIGPEELLFLKRYSECELTLNRFQGKEEKGKGPMVMLIDRSGSMGGHNEIWARGVMLAMQNIAREDKRDFYCIYYDHRVFKEIFLPLGNPQNSQEWMAFVSIGSDGGTDFESPLNRAINLIETNRKFAKGDIVMISDGECNISDQFLANFKKKQQELDFKTLGVLIGGQARVMNKFCEKVVNVNDMRKDSEALHQMFSV